VLLEEAATKNAASPLASGLVQAGKLLLTGTGRVAKPLLWPASVVATPYVAQKGFMDFVYPQLKEDFKGTAKDIKAGAPILIQDTINNATKMVSDELAAARQTASDKLDVVGKDFSNRADIIQAEILNSVKDIPKNISRDILSGVSSAGKDVLADTGRKIKDIAEQFKQLGEQTAGQSALAAAVTGGGLLGYSALRNQKKQRQHDASLHQNKDHRKPQ
jgi:hypothetical protein